MSFYEQGWQAPVRQASWEQPPPPSRSGASSASQREESSAFAQQFEEIDKAYDNLQKSGKLFAGNARGPMSQNFGGMAPMGHRAHSGRHSVGDFRTPPPRPATNQQNYYASQRFQGRPAEADQMAQAKRRMAAQRERELRNYHQEQQYNRSLLAEMASNKSDRSMSPSTLSEEGRRELIARQHRALYGEGASSYGPPGSFNADTPPGESGQQSGPASMRVASPRGIDPFGMSQSDMSQQTVEAKTTSPISHQQGQVTTPPNDEPSHSRTISKSTTAPLSGGVGPIGSRPNQQQPVGAQNMTKRTTSPLPSALSFYGPGEQNDRTNSQTGNATKESTTPAMGVWGTGSGVWGNKLGASGWS